MSYTVRKMLKNEIEFAVEEAADQGWNPGLADGDCFYNTDPDGFFIGLHNGVPVGCISAVAYDNVFGFIGFYIVKPEHQNTELAVRLSLAARARLGGRNIGLDGVFERQENYAALGFKFAYSNIRFEATGLKGGADGLKPAAEVGFEDLCKYDSMCFPAKRENFLRMWLNLKDSKALVYEDNGKIKGYGMIRQCRTGYKIGPLFADNSEIAEKLFSALAGSTGGANVYFDIPEINSEALKIAEKYDMKRVFGTARMYSKKMPEMEYKKIFGVTTFELG